MRYGADIAAWWDRHGAALGACALEPVAAEHPELDATLTVAALVADRLVGVPAQALLGEQRLARRRSDRATRLARWAGEPRRPARFTTLGVRDVQRATQVALADWLLTDRRSRGAVIRRHVLLPRPVLAGIYGYDERARLRHLIARSRYGITVGGELTLRGGAALWRLRKKPPHPLVGQA